MLPAWQRLQYTVAVSLEEIVACQPGDYCCLQGSVYVGAVTLAEIAVCIDVNLAKIAVNSCCKTGEDNAFIGQ
jgi:hypothetical protein